MSSSSWVTSRRVVHSGGLSAAAIEVCSAQGIILSVVAQPEGVHYADWIGQLSAKGVVDDRGDNLITPAFIDSHTHLPLNMLRGTGVNSAAAGNVVEDLFYRVESELEPGDVRAFATLGAMEALIHGTGLVWEHYFFAEELSDAIAETGLCAVVAPTIQDLSGPGLGSAEAQLDFTLSLASEGGRRGLFAALGPHATDTVSAEMWRRLAQLAERHNLPVHCHLAQSVDEVRRVAERENTTPVGLLSQTGLLDAAPTSLLIHNLFVTRQDLLTLANHRDHVRMGFCPRSQWTFAFPADPRRWEAMNIDWVLGTDCPASNDTLSVGLELASCAAALRERVAHSAVYEDFVAGRCTADAVWEARQAERQRCPEEADVFALLDHAWKTPGQMHPAMRAGCIEQGALANLISWDTNHPSLWPAQTPLRALTQGVPSGTIEQVMTRGVWRGDREGYAESIRRSDAYQAGLEEATDRRNKLLRRAGLDSFVD